MKRLTTAVAILLATGILCVTAINFAVIAFLPHKDAMAFLSAEGTFAFCAFLLLLVFG